MRKLLVGTFVALLLAGCGDGKTSDYEAPAKWAEWKANPKPYGGIGTLAKIREAEVNGTTELFLAYNNITDVSPLAGLTNLTWLVLPFNEITDLTPLAGLTNLEALHLDNNQITDLAPLAKLTNLKTLNLWKNPITDVTPLMGLTKLRGLNLINNPITDDQKEMLRKALPNCTIYF